MIHKYFKLVTIFYAMMITSASCAMEKHQLAQIKAVDEFEEQLRYSPSPKGVPGPSAEIRRPTPQKIRLKSLSERIDDQEELLEKDKWCHECIIQYFSGNCTKHKEHICKLKAIIDEILLAHIPSFDYNILRYTTWDLSKQIIQYPQFLAIFPIYSDKTKNAEQPSENVQGVAPASLSQQSKNISLEELKSKLLAIKNGGMIEQFKALVYSHYWWMRTPKTSYASKKRPFAFSYASHQSHYFSVI